MLRYLCLRRLGIAVTPVLLVVMLLVLTVAPQVALAQSYTASINPNQGQVGMQNSQVVVTSNVQWVNTGITLNAGDTLKISASGSWSADPGDGLTTPDGYTQQSPDNFLNLTDIGVCSSCASTLTPHWGALIGYIGANPPAAGSYTSTSILPEAQKVFVVGSNFQSSAEPTGNLWLNFNDDAYSANTGDNAGQVTATINVASRPLGGTWVTPGKGFTVKNSPFHFAAHAYGGAGVDHVNFTAKWKGVNPAIWAIACVVTSPTPGTTDLYECDWNVNGLPKGTLTVGFDVYDRASNRILSPNGTHQGTVNLTLPPKLQVPTYGFIGYLFHQQLAGTKGCLDVSDPSLSHQGIDIWTNQKGNGTNHSSPEGSEVWAAAKGTLIGIFDTHNNSVSATNPKASTLLIDNGLIGINGEHIYTLYAHMANADGTQTYVDPGLFVGKSIAQGDILGHQGNADKSTNSDLITHLHFEVKTTATAGNDIDPSPYLGHQVDRCNPSFPGWLASFP